MWADGLPLVSRERMVAWLELHGSPFSGEDLKKPTVTTIWSLYLHIIKVFDLLQEKERTELCEFMDESERLRGLDGHSTVRYMAAVFIEAHRKLVALFDVVGSTGNLYGLRDFLRPETERLERQISALMHLEKALEMAKLRALAQELDETENLVEEKQEKLREEIDEARESDADADELEDKILLLRDIRRTRKKIAIARKVLLRQQADFEFCAV